MEFQCLLCGDLKFCNRYGVVRHLEEKHSGFRWECQLCSKLFPRQANGTHNDAKGRVCQGSVFLCVAPDASSRGSAARSLLDKWRKTALPNLWKSVPVKGQFQIMRKRQSRKESPPHKRARPTVAVDVSDVSPAKTVASLPPSPQISMGVAASSSSRSRSPTPKRKIRKVKSKAIIDESSSESSESSSESSGNGSPSPVRTVVSETVLPPVTPPVTPKKTPPSTPTETVVNPLGAARTSVIRVLPDVAPILTSLKEKLSVVPAVLSYLSELQEAQESQLVLNVGGSEFRTSRVTLLKDPHSKFASMLSKDSPVRPDKSGKYFLDRDPHHFRLILNYLRNNCNINSRVLTKDIRYLNELLLEAEFYHLGGLVKVINTRLQALYALD